jgi:hypothetical protein
VVRRHGGDPVLGRKLHRCFALACIPVPGLTIVQHADLDGDGKRLVGLTVEGTAEDLVRDGIANRDEIEAALASLADFAEDRGSVCGSPRLFQAWSRRGTG